MEFNKPKDNWNVSDIPNLANKVAVVTGGTSGVGYEVAKALANHRATVHIIARNKQKGDKAIQNIKNITNNENVYFHSVNLMSLKDIKAVGTELNEITPQVDILINNAGIMMPANASTTEDGLESMWATNYFSGFTLTMSLLPSLRKSGAARVVNLTSIATGRPKIEYDNLDGHDYNASQIYIATKLAQALVTRSLNREFKKRNIAVKALAASPGLSATNLVTKNAGATSVPMRVAAFLFRIFPNLRQSAEMGALSTLFAATDPSATAGAVYAPNNRMGTKGYPGMWGWNESKYMNDSDADKLLQESLKVTNTHF